MTESDQGREEQALEQVLGYLNFSSGTTDPKLLANLDLLWGSLAREASRATWQQVGLRLGQQLDSLTGVSGAFQDASQATAVLALVFDKVLPAYREFHRDLLFHQTDESLFNGFFVGRVCESVLRQGPPWEEAERIVAAAINDLNDFVGYRPVAVLESRRIEPYPHERVRPVPLFVKDVGVAVGPYRQVVQQALDLLRLTDEDILRSASFDPQTLDELALDPRAYDFDHPVNKRPNYHFGLWDPYQIDNQGRYRRFVVQQVTLDALMQRLDGVVDLPPSEAAFEAAAVLAGTILMAAGVSGRGPGTHDSATTLSNLLPRIAAYRDEFYERLLNQAAPDHAERLRAEAILRRQPFGAARQHLNAQLARRRAAQLEHVQLAKLFARMGYPDAAMDQAEVVPNVAARMLCEIDCRLTAVRQSLDAHNPEGAGSLLEEIVERLLRGIACGAIVDPWNILGFDAQFSLFPSLENSVHDHRVDELIELIEEVLALYSRAWSESSASNRGALSEQLSLRFRELAEWWRQFAPHTVSNVEAADPHDIYRAAEHVASAIRLWHQGGAAAGDIGFWAPHAEIFDSPQAYALVLDALFEQSDYVATMGLLMHWLGESERVSLEHAENSFHRLAERWIVETCQPIPAIAAEADSPAPPTGEAIELPGISCAQWQRIRKFFDFMEANAERLWRVPTFELGGKPPAEAAATDEPFPSPLDEDGDDEGLFSAAYEDVVFRDSADDGVEGELADSGHPVEDELGRESERLGESLAFIGTLARLWRITALSPLAMAETGDVEAATARAERVAALERWSGQAERNRHGLMQLLDAVQAYRIPAPLGDHDSMVDYDRRRVLKESLLERLIATAVETTAAARLLNAARAAELQGMRTQEAEVTNSGDEGALIVATIAALFCRDLPALDERIDDLMETWARLPLLYVPLAKGGKPRDIVAIRARQRCFQDLLKCLPRVGFLVATCKLIETARDMERNHPVGPGAVTEFDELFKIGFKALVHALVTSSEGWEEEPPGDGPEPYHSPLVARLEQLTEALLISWLAHSRTLRLSVLEKVNDKRSWKKLVSFVERYGGDLFNQRFLNIGNIRAILHQDVDRWLERLEAEVGDQLELRLLDELDREISRTEAVEMLTVILESIVENYGEYRDYNSTTTQSDRGDMLYTLLDFLRLRARYDRVCWNLKPVVIAHEILVRRRRKRAAQIWRRALRDRIGEEADKFQKKLVDLQTKYAMQMPSIADRIGERFVRPMVIDRICSLVQPAVNEASRQGPHPTFRILQYEIEFLTREPTGVGFDVPAWLVSLEDEVQRVRTPPHERDDYDELRVAVPAIVLSEDEIETQLDDWTGKT